MGTRCVPPSSAPPEIIPAGALLFFCMWVPERLESSRKALDMSTVTVSSSARELRITVRSIARAKREGKKLTMLTAYDFTFARIFDSAGIEMVLVGDSLGNVMQGCDTTLPVTLDDVVYHTRMVVRGCERALVIADMPFGSYQVGPEDAVRSAIRLVKEGGAQAVKLEGSAHVAEAIERIVAAQIPVMGHVGLTPQSVNQMGGFRVQGRGPKGRDRIISDALRVEQAGAFAVVLEGLPEDLAGEITGALRIPTIGIGAGVHCDGQVLVMHDLLGLNDWTPSFVKQYANLGALTSQAARAFAEEVRNGKFPDDDHSYS